MDVDGTLTDGKIYIGDAGEVFKAFEVKDGYGLKEILPKHEIVPVIITARNIRMLTNRCNELDIYELHQGIRKKICELEKIILDYSMKDYCEYSFENIAYIGDDVLDLQCMTAVKENGGVVACPNDAVRSVLEIADFICTKKGGEGAVREFIDWLVDMRRDIKKAKKGGMKKQD